MLSLVSLLISFTLTVSGVSLSHSHAIRNRIHPERHHRIFIDSSNDTGITGSFDIYYEIDSGVKIGCRGGIKIGQEEVSELYVEDEGGLHRIGQSSFSQRSKLRLVVIPDLSKSANKLREADQSIENIGLDHFRLWPRECVLGLLRYRIDDLVAEEAHRDAASGFMKVKTYRVAPHLDKEARLLWWRWNWLSAILGIGNGDNDGDGHNGGGNGGGHCLTCATWGGGGAIQGGNNNDQTCNYLNITISKGGEVSVKPTQPDGAGGRPQAPPPREELLSEEPVLHMEFEPPEINEAIDLSVLDNAKSSNDTTSNEANDDAKRDPDEPSSGSNKLGSGGTIHYPTITVTVGGGGGGGGGGDLSPGGSGGDAAGMTIASANSNLNNGFYGCNNDHVVFYGPSIVGIRDPCPTFELKSALRLPASSC